MFTDAAFYLNAHLQYSSGPLLLQFNEDTVALIFI